MLSQLARSEVSIRQEDDPHSSICSTSRAVRSGSRYGSILDNSNVSPRQRRQPTSDRARFTYPCISVLSIASVAAVGFSAWW